LLSERSATISFGRAFSSSSSRKRFNSVGIAGRDAFQEDDGSAPPACGARLMRQGRGRKADAAEILRSGLADAHIWLAHGNRTDPGNIEPR
jgi:hypothetical protein